MTKCKHCGEDIGEFYADDPGPRIWLHYRDGRLVSYCNLVAEPA